MTDTKKREKARQAPTYSLKGETGQYNLSPTGFRLWAKQYYECRQSFQCPDFSPVPYFLLCRAIKLQFKAVHLEQKRQAEVKKAYGHDLIKSYEDLPVDIKKKLSLSSKQLSLLEQANKIYSGKGFEELPLLELANKHRGKGFEYVNVGDALRGFSNFPDLKDLDELAKAIMTAPPFVQPGA
jgi:hypothetical protein